jgi:heme oxygenase (biliverdin-IX-beta and delta-forming)
MSIASAEPANATTLRQMLKRGTAHVHRRLESQLGLLAPELDLHRYRRILELFYGFYAPIERILIPLAAMFPFPLRARAALIENDLSILGLARDEIAALPCCTAFPDLSSCDGRAGCVYVLEGASLGGQAVTPLLRRRIGVAKDSGASFFAGDEAGTAARWGVVLEWLEQLHQMGAAPQPIVAAATATFEALAGWVDGQEPSWSQEASWST